MKTLRIAVVALASLVPIALACPSASAAALFPLGNLSYRSIGPAIAGGRTTAVVGSNRDASLYYAGGADGGVFKSRDGGASWLPVFDRAGAAAIGAIALAPDDANDVWVGTGESNPRNDVAMGDGIWHSRDGGKTWEHLGLDDAGSISSIAIDPRDARNVAVGVLGQTFRDSTMRGVYVTHDGGAHWKRTLYVGPSSGASDLLRLPGRPSTLIAGIYQFRRQPWTMTSGGPAGGLYRSDDNGATWRKLEGHGLPGGPTGRIGLAAANGRIYAIVESKRGELWRSDDGGTTWARAPHSTFVGGRPFYFSKIFVDPSNRNRVVDVGLVLSRSTDGGRSFAAIAQNDGWDYHAGWWSADGRRLIVGSDEGVVISADGGNRWGQPYDLPFAQPYHLGLGPLPVNYRVCIGLQDDDSWCGPSRSNNSSGILNRNWITVGPGDGMWAIPDPTDRALIWSTSTNNATGQVYLFSLRTLQAPERSPDMAINGGEPAKNLKYRFNWDTPIAFTTDAKPLVLVGGNVVFASADRGLHWSVISPDLTRNDTAHQQIPGGPIHADMSGAETYDTILDIQTTKRDPKLIWVGTDDGLVQLTRDGGAHWSAVTPPGTPHWGRVQVVEPSSISAARAYVAVDNHRTGDDRPYLFRTDDYGATWHSIVGNLPTNRYVRVVREDPYDPNLLFAGTQRGVYATFDGGAHWQSLRLNMPASAIYDLQIQAADHDLVVASHGRGVWILDDVRALETLGATPPDEPVLVAPRPAWRTWQWLPINSFAEGLPDNTFVGANPPYGALLTYYLPFATRVAPSIEILDAGGHVVRHLHAHLPHRIGLNRTSWDLAVDGPVKWRGTFALNAGPDEGPLVVPGRYTVRVKLGRQTLSQPLRVTGDWRDRQSATAYRARYDFLMQLDAELSGVDTWLNAIDARLQKHDAHTLALRTFARQLTYNPQTDEDLGGPPGLRERILDLQARASTSFQPPTAAIETAAAAVRVEYDRLAAAYPAL